MSDPPAYDPLAITPRQHVERLHRFAHQAMTCEWGLYVHGKPEPYARQVARAVFAEVDRVEREISRFMPTSDVARLNALPPGQWLRLGVDAFECLELAARMHAETHGAFDVTIGALLGNRPAGAADRPPAVGLKHLQLDRPGRSAAVCAAGLIVDLGGIGKGYAIDQGIAILRDWSVTAALLHSGQSTAYALGRPAESGWCISVRDPLDQTRVLGVIHLCDEAFSGSGQRLHGPHILDPRTGQPAQNALAAWAAAPSAAVADALSTAFMVLSPQEVDDYCRQHARIAGWLYVPTSAGHALHRYGRPLDGHGAGSE